MIRGRLCHYCGHPLPDIRLGVRMPPLKTHIFDVVHRAGPDGISGRDLYDIVYEDHEEPRPKMTSLHSHVNQINEAIEDSGYRIRGNTSTGRGYYRLVKI